MMADDDGFVKTNSSGSCELWSDSGYVMKLAPTGFPDLVNVGCK